MLTGRFERWIVAGWNRRGLVFWSLFVPAWLFARGAAWRRRRFLDGRVPVFRADVPVIIVGNLIAGGAGKTPVVIALVEALRARGRSPGVVTRGYGGSGASEPRFAEADADPACVGDEPVLIARRTGAPVAVHANRAAAVRALRNRHPEIDVIVCDDGLQHYALARDVELVVYDARGAGNGAHLPAGPLREAVDRPRSATVFAGCAVDPALAAGAPAFAVPVEPAGLYALGRPEEALDSGLLAGRPVCAYAGIAHPDKFFATLRALGAKVDAHLLPDHAAFDADSFADAGDALIVITEKDAVKCARIPALAADARVHVLSVQARLPQALIDLVTEKLDGPQAA